MKSVYKPKPVVAAASALAVVWAVVGGAGVATAEEPASPIDVIAELTPTVLDDLAGTSELPTTSGGTITTDGLSVSIELPFSAVRADAQVDSGAVFFDNQNDSTTVPLVKRDGSIQIVTVIDGAAAPTRYNYGLGLSEGSSLSLSEDGFVLITNADGSFAGGILPAWAVDADGKSVPTHYEVSGRTVTQVVEHDATSAFPIVADPWLGNNLFTGVVTGSENGQPRYMLYRSPWGAAVSQGTGVGVGGVLVGQQIMLNEGWAEVSNLVPALLSKASLHEQYDCHVFYAAFKPDSWNLEKYRANNSGWGSNPQGCNWP